MYSCSIMFYWLFSRQTKRIRRVVNSMNYTSLIIIDQWLVCVYLPLFALNLNKIYVLDILHTYTGWKNEIVTSTQKQTIFKIRTAIFSLRKVRKTLTTHFFLWSIKTTSQTKIFLYTGEFDRGAILNKKPVSPRSDKRKAHDWMRYSESDYSVTRISRLNAILGNLPQYYQNRRFLAFPRRSDCLLQGSCKCY